MLARLRSVFWLGLLVLALDVQGSSAETVTFNTVVDRWMYPHAISGGTRDLAPTFGSIGSPNTDNRNGQFIVGFDTAAQIPLNQGAALYQINSVIVRAMVGLPDGFLYDTSYDSYRTYLPTTATWAIGYPGMSWGSTYGVYNSDRLITGSNEWFTFRSDHPGGAHFGMVDGAVRFVPDTIDAAVLNALATRDGGEPVADNLLSQ